MSTVQPDASGAIEVAPIEDSSLLAFYRDMNPPERRTFWACASGWALDGMDFMIYPLVIGTIITLWKVDPGTAGLAGTVTLLGPACGGEGAAGAVLMGEAIRPQYRGRAVGSVQSGWAVGWGLAVLAQAILFSYLPAEIAWRWMFAIGALPALLVFYLRRYVKEPEIAAATREKQVASGDRPALWEIFEGPILKTTILASLMATGCQGGDYGITFWVPRFITTERKLSIVSS